MQLFLGCTMYLRQSFLIFFVFSRSVSISKTGPILITDLLFHLVVVCVLGG